MRRSGLRRLPAWSAAAVLTFLGAAFYFTREPAPFVMVRWREGATAERRADIERRFGLRHPRDPEGRSVMYDLVDTRPEHLQELLEQPEVERTGYIDEQSFTVPAEAPDGVGWMWAGDRLVISPELRIYRVVPAVVTLCALAIGFTVASVVVARRRRICRIAAFVSGWRRPRFGRAAHRLTR